jgi:integrase/recombinase XerC
MTDFFLSFLKFQKRVSPHTLRAYHDDLSGFETFLKAHYEKNAIQAGYKEVRHWMSYLAEQGLSPSSINRKMATLRAFYKFMLAEGQIITNPMQKMRAVKMRKRLPVFVREDVMSQAQTYQELFPDGFEGIRDRLVLELLYGTGMRLAELINLKNNDINLYAGVITVIGKRNKQRLVPISKYFQKIIEEYHSAKKKEFLLLEHDSLVVTNKGEPAYPVFIQRIIKKYLNLMGHNEKASPHVLRHTFATHLLNNGADINAVKELLGHASLAATQVYTHNTFEKLKKIHKQAHPKA